MEVLIVDRNKTAWYPRQLSTELICRLGEKLARGVLLDTAFRLLGVRPNVYRDWMYQGQKVLERLPDTDEIGGVFLSDREFLLVELIHAIDVGLGMNEEALVNVVMNATKEDWKAGAWLLERTHPGFAKKTEIKEIKGEKVNESVEQGMEKYAALREQLVIED